MDPYLRDVLDVCLRMLHVIAGIAWIGGSFYFVRLDLGLRPPKHRDAADAGVAGEFWGVHGGGLCRSQKYGLGPREMPEPLHWFKWEAYTTWLSGFSLLVLLYYLHADIRLVDPSVADLETWQAVGPGSPSGPRSGKEGGGGCRPCAATLPRMPNNKALLATIPMIQLRFMMSLRY